MRDSEPRWAAWRLLLALAAGLALSATGYSCLVTLLEMRSHSRSHALNRAPFVLDDVGLRIQIYELRKKRVPTSAEGLAIVYENEPVPTDAWGNALVYRSPGPNGASWQLTSLGEDGSEGGTGFNADLTLVPPEHGVR